MRFSVSCGNPELKRRCLEDRGVLVNAVAPGPIWTPLIPLSFDTEHVSEFGADTPMKRPGQPDEIARVMWFSQARNRRICPVRCCIRTVVKSSTADPVNTDGVRLLWEEPTC